MRFLDRERDRLWLHVHEEIGPETVDPEWLKTLEK